MEERSTLPCIRSFQGLSALQMCQSQNYLTLDFGFLVDTGYNFSLGLRGAWSRLISLALKPGPLSNRVSWKKTSASRGQVPRQSKSLTNLTEGSQIKILGTCRQQALEGATAAELRPVVAQWVITQVNEADLLCQV